MQCTEYDVIQPPYVTVYTAYHIGNIHFQPKNWREGEEGAVVGCERLLRPLRPTGCRRRHNEQKTRMTKETYFESNTVIRANILLPSLFFFFEQNDFEKRCSTAAQHQLHLRAARHFRNVCCITFFPPPQKYEQEMYNLCCFSSNQGVKASSTRLLMD
jgi:hypothetical protein